MKRQAGSIGGAPSPKKPRQKEPEYHLTPSVRDEHGEIIWPAPREQMEDARRVIRECAEKGQRTLICPDKDADGLTSGVILTTTLVLLGQPRESISVHLLRKGESIHSQVERDDMAAYGPAYIFVLDQGSRAAPPLIDAPHTGLVIDHHFASPTDCPATAHFVNASASPPVATSSLLTYELCRPLHASVAAHCAWLCAVGTHGDLGNTLKWAPPFPDMAATFKQHTKKSVNDAVALLNAPRRTAAFDVRSAWDALVAASSLAGLSSPSGTADDAGTGAGGGGGGGGPKALLQDARLLRARAEIAAEVERCTHTPPRFTPDTRVAVLRICSAAQVHPLIATRWAAHLASAKLEFVLVANAGYAPGKVHFSCRVARAARSRGHAVDIIASLKAYAALHESGTLAERLGDGFARGHVQASGGAVGAAEFEELMAVMRVGERPDGDGGGAGEGQGEGLAGRNKPKGSPGRKGALPAQKNTLANYFGKG